MTNKNASEQKKNAHIQINLKEDVNSTLGTGFEKYRLLHNALPEIAFSDVDPSQALFGRKLDYPVLISSMTGGTSEAAKINQILAAIAQEFGLSMGVGSQRVAIEKPETLFSFKVRETAPDILLFANLGAVQLNYAFS